MTDAVPGAVVAPPTEPAQSRQRPLASLATQTAIYAAGKIIGRLASFIMLPVYTRYLAPADYGTLELLSMTIDVIGMIAGSGLAASVFRFHSEGKTPAERDEVISTATLSLATIALMTATVGLLLATPLSRLVLGPAAPTTYLRVFFIVYFFTSVSNVPMMFLRARHHAVEFVSVNVAHLVLVLSLNILFVVGMRLGVMGVMLSMLIGSSASALYLSVRVLREVGFHFSAAKLRAMMRFGHPLVYWSVGAFILAFSDRYFLKHFADHATVGIYSLAYKFGFLLIMLAARPFNDTWEADRFEVAQQPDGSRKVGQVFFFFNLPLLFLAFVIAISVHDVLRVMAAPAYWPAARLVPLILLAFVAQAWTNFSSLGVQLKNRTSWQAFAAGGSVLVVLVANWLLIPPFGMWGAAVATLIAYATRLALVFPAGQRLFRVRYPWGRVGLLAGVLVAIYAGRQVVPVRGIAWSLGATAGAVALAALVVYHVVLQPDERLGLARMVRRLPPFRRART